MATKTTTAKAKSKTVSKKVTKKPATKRTVVKKKTVSKVAKQPEFMETRFTDQTLYWLIFGIAAITFALWLFSLDSKVRDLYDQIEANSYINDTPVKIEKSE